MIKFESSRSKNLFFIMIVAVLIITAAYIAMNKDSAFNSKAKELCQEKDSTFLEASRYGKGMAVTCYKIVDDKIIEAKFFMPLS